MMHRRSRHDDPLVVAIEKHLDTHFTTSRALAERTDQHFMCLELLEDRIHDFVADFGVAEFIADQLHHVRVDIEEKVERDRRKFVKEQRGSRKKTTPEDRAKPSGDGQTVRENPAKAHDRPTDTGGPK